MRAFRYERPTTLAAAVRVHAEGDVLLKANGLDVLDRMKERIDEPTRVVTLSDVPGLDRIELAADGSLRVGAMATLAAVAASKEVRDACPALAEAAEQAASPQLRNRATVGGNLCQHTRCGYYRMKSFPCFKRGDPACPVLAPGAVQETAGIFGIGACACAHPSSLAPAVGAVGGVVVVQGPKGERKLSLAELYEPPQQGKASDTTLVPGEIIVRIEIPALVRGPGHQAYYEVRQRAAFDWALVSCAVSFVGGEQGVKEARVWLGSVSPSPIRSEAAEKALVGKPFSEALAVAAGDAAVTGSTPLPGTLYKTELVKVAVRRALLAAWGRK